MLLLLVKRPGLTVGVMSVAFSPDVWHIISRSIDTVIGIWDAETVASDGCASQARDMPRQSSHRAYLNRQLRGGGKENTTQSSERREPGLFA